MRHNISHSSETGALVCPARRCAKHRQNQPALLHGSLLSGAHRSHTNGPFALHAPTLAAVDERLPATKDCYVLTYLLTYPVCTIF